MKRYHLEHILERISTLGKVTVMTIPNSLEPNTISLATVAVLAVPLLYLVAIAIPSRIANGQSRRFAKGVAGVALISFFLAVFAAVLQFMNGPARFAFGFAESITAHFYFDTLTAVMLLLVSFLGAVVTRYSVTYLDGNPDHGRFMKWLSVTIGSVTLLIVSGNLLLFTIAWVATSLSLHQLLTFFHNRPAGILAARKKFLISRLGDACLVATLFLTWNCFGTWEFAGIFSKVEEIRASGAALPGCLAWSAVCLIGGALLKSAQFPFHSWLPDTMETPTPVSALMHAGIINAGGFLVVRLSPIVSSAPMAMNVLAIVGAVTAIFASVVMLTQTSVKRSLAYSTVAQMGFMMLQCGLGAFALAVLHIVAHSLYKAHAFLSSGSTVSIAKSSWTPDEKPSAQPVLLVAVLAAATLLTVGVGSLFGLNFGEQPGVLLLGSIFLMALAYFFWNLWAASRETALIGFGFAIGIAAAVAYFGLHLGSKTLLAKSISQYSPERSPIEYAVMILVFLLFAAVLFAQSQLPAWSLTKTGQRFYVLVSKGFYLGTYANKLTRKFSRELTA